MIAIIDYEAGNLKSVERAVKKLDFPCRVTQDSDEISGSDRVIFPGVGAAGAAMADLRRLGLDAVLQRVFEAGKPILGICLGTQIILEQSEENDARCLGLVKGYVKRFPRPLFSEENERLKIPHMGWNGVRLGRNHPVFNGIVPGDEFYFVHAYYPEPEAKDCIIGTTDYGIAFPSVIGYRNLVAMQFHPEKSGTAGLRILENFCTWDGRDVE